jgi:hypothetical protein
MTAMDETDHTTIDDDDDDVKLPVIADPTALGVWTRTEIESAMTLAQKKKRDIAEVKKDIEKLAILDPDCAEENVYALPRGGKPVRGASIRLAEIIQTQWGNNRVWSGVVSTDRVNKWVTAVGIFFDLEKNTCITKQSSRRISDKNGRIFSDDMIITTQNAACSIAQRNAILAGVPRTVWRKAYEMCEQVLAGDIATLVERRDKAFKAFAAFGVKPEQICAVLDVKNIDGITLEHMPTLIAMHTAIKSGEATVEELFDPRRAAVAGFAPVKNPLADDEPQPNRTVQPSKPDATAADGTAGAAVSGEN